MIRTLPDRRLDSTRPRPTPREPGTPNGRTAALRRIVLLLLPALLGLAPAPAATQPAQGHWQGQVEPPGQSLDLVVDLATLGDAWFGTIAIPAQGLAGFPLAALEVDGDTVTFAMAGVPGRPTVQARLSAAGDVLEGTMAQGGASFPLRLERTGDAQGEPPWPLVDAATAAALVGAWPGALTTPAGELDVVFRFAEAASGDGAGVRLAVAFDSPDQGQTGLPATAFSVEERTVRVELSYAGAVFEGELSADGARLVGTWTQGGSLPLTLERQGEASGDAADPDTPGSEPRGAARRSAAASVRDPAGPDAFPVAQPEEVGLDPRGLELLVGVVEGLLADDAFVGGELVVIKDRRTVLREVFGDLDRDAGEPMPAGALYCVRSMTKPLVGTAIQMLVDEGRLGLDTRVAEILPSFDRDATRDLTVEHLLTHTSGFPLTTIARALDGYDDLADVAAEAAATGLEFEPGTRFGYSDANSDTLGAIVEAITGAPVADFLQRRLLDPLGMADSVTLLEEGGEELARVPPAHSGGTGAWETHWTPADGPLFPLFLASQGLYATTGDYARFLALWMDRGVAPDGRRLLSEEAVGRALSNGRTMDGYPGGLGDLHNAYAQQWQVYPDADGKVVAFGHSGSDGTHAWAWPDEDLIVLFFTQSRGTLAGVRLEEVLQPLLVDGDLDAVAARLTEAPPPADLDALAGIYWDEDQPDSYYELRPLGRGLEMIRPGRGRMAFLPDPDQPGRFVAERAADQAIDFVRSEAGSVVAMRTFGRDVETCPRHVTDPGLPSTAEVVARVLAAHRIDRLAEEGALRIEGGVTFESRGATGTSIQLVEATRSLSVIEMRGTRQVALVADGRAWVDSSAMGASELDGTRRVQQVHLHPSVLYGDWRRHYETVEVLRRTAEEGVAMLQVRVATEGAPGETFWVEEESGRLVRIDRVLQVPGLGFVGVRTGMSDFRDVAGMILPFRTEETYATPLVGRIVAETERAEVGVELPPETFTPEHARNLVSEGS